MIGTVYELVYPYGSYIGSTKKLLEKRIKEHTALLKRNKHFNIILQRAFIKYGEFEIKTLEILSCNTIKEIRDREQYYLDTLKPLYNISKTANCPDKFVNYENLITKHYNSLNPTIKDIVIKAYARGFYLDYIIKKYKVTKEVAESDLNKLIGMGLLKKVNNRYFASEELKEIFKENGIY